MKSKSKSRGYSVLEMVMAVLIFSLFLGAVFGIFNYGLKNWKVVETKSDVQSQGEVAMGRMVSDMTATDISTMSWVPCTGYNNDSYVAFETAVNPATGQAEKDQGLLLWQGYILYFTIPYVNNVGKTDKKLVRKYLPHTPSTTPKELTSISSYLTETCHYTGEKVRTVARNIYSLDIQVNSNQYIVDMTLVTYKRFSERRLAYQKDFSDKVGNATLTLKASIMPRNTQN
jgi:hypothetical protein